MGLNTEFDLKDMTGEKIIKVTPLNNGRFRLWNIRKHFNCENYIVDETELESFKQKYNLTVADQTSIFDFI